jgi:hypothetical protein
MGNLSLAWRRSGHVFISLAEGAGPLNPALFELFLADLSQPGFTHFLSIARGAPFLTAQQRRRILSIPGTEKITMAVVFDGSPIVRSVALAFSWFMPRVKIFRGTGLSEALHYLGLTCEEAEEVRTTVSSLRRMIAPGEKPAAAATGTKG